jgi:hypothetical protein
MAVESKKQPKDPIKMKSPCGSNCQEFVSKTCPGEETGCAIYWRFSQGFRK